MARLSYAQATANVLKCEMRKDPSIIVMGEDIAELGGCFGDLQGVYEEFGPDRVRNTPISENAFIGAAIGAAACGLRPIANLMYDDFSLVCMDQILNQAAKLRYMSGGKIKLPMVIRAPQGIGGGNAGQHSQLLEAFFVHVPGLKLAIPSTPTDLTGLLRTAIYDDNPVIFLDHRRYYLRSLKEDVPDDPDFRIPFGKAKLVREGSDVTIVALQICMQKSLEAAKELEKEGISCEIIDPRTLVPFDREAVINSVKKTGRLIVAHEAIKTGGIGGEIISSVLEDVFDYLKASPLRVGSAYCTVPYSYVLEEAMIPQEKDIFDAVKKVCKK